MKIKTLTQNNKIVLLDKTQSPHTRGIIDSMLATLGYDKSIVNLDDVFGCDSYINPLLNHVGHKSMANIIIPKLRVSKDALEFVNVTRDILCEFLYASEHLHGKLCPYQLIDDSESVASLKVFSEKVSDIGILQSPLKMLFNENSLVEIQDKLKQIIMHQYVDKIRPDGSLKTEIMLQQYLRAEEVFYLSSQTDDGHENSADNLILNSIKSIDRVNTKSPCEAWIELSEILTNEIDLFNTSPTVHSDMFLDKCSSLK